MGGEQSPLKKMGWGARNLDATSNSTGYSVAITSTGASKENGAGWLKSVLGALFSSHLHESALEGTGATGSSQQVAGFCSGACIAQFEPHTSFEQNREANAPPEEPMATKSAKNSRIDIVAAVARLTSPILTRSARRAFLGSHHRRYCKPRKRLPLQSYLNSTRPALNSKSKPR